MSSLTFCGWAAFFGTFFGSLSLYISFLSREAVLYICVCVCVRRHLHIFSCSFFISLDAKYDYVTPMLCCSNEDGPAWFQHTLVWWKHRPLSALDTLSPRFSRLACCSFLLSVLLPLTHPGPRGLVYGRLRPCKEGLYGAKTKIPYRLTIDHLGFGEKCRNTLGQPSVLMMM